MNVGFARLASPSGPLNRAGGVSAASGIGLSGFPGRSANCPQTRCCARKVLLQP
jgi:hypothetical protein